MKQIGIIGASGYTGAELVRIIAGHPGMQIAALIGNSRAGEAMGALYPHLAHLGLPDLIALEQADLGALDLVFCALPHATSQRVIAGLPRDLKIVDLSADFRLSDPADYEKWYGQPHAAPELQREAVYGLTEFDRAGIAGARLVAGTGCNAAMGQYMLRPLIAAGVIDPDQIVLDMKCAVSGAGRSVKEHLLHGELSEGYHPYAAGGTHRHLGEFDEAFSRLAGRPVRIQFTPHLIPANRGILATGYVQGDAEAIHAALSSAYAGEPFIKVLPMGALPSTRHVRGSNLCLLSVVSDRIAGRATVFGALDNLTKGSSGQAVQNANLMLGLNEVEGLEFPPLFP